MPDNKDAQMIRRVGCTTDQQKELATIFAKRHKDGTLTKLDLSTVRNYLNESRYHGPKARRMREYAIKMWNCKWVTTVIG